MEAQLTKTSLNSWMHETKMEQPKYIRQFQQIVKKYGKDLKEQYSWLIESLV